MAREKLMKFGLTLIPANMSPLMGMNSDLPLRVASRSAEMRPSGWRGSDRLVSLWPPGMGVMEERR